MFSDPNSCELCQPIRMVDVVINWQQPKHPNWAENVIKRTERSKECFKGLRHCRTDFIPNDKFSRNNVPKTLYCHDMAGGYLHDKYVKGTDKNEGFEFFRWACIDIFVYFSHNLLTIPPLGWINAAHKNGVTVLGTLITEGSRGEAIWNKLLMSKIVIEKFTNSLANICKFYGFDGYLINVENRIEPEKIGLFCEFIRNLKDRLKNDNADNLLIWYDSVIYPHGHVYYQNALNDLNKPFFDLCDGIFLNYTWTEKDLEMSLMKAGQRKLDVFVGVDVFGRGCKGGGGFGTVEAVEEVRKRGLSVALFAPGWVHECCQPGEQFLSRDYKFWDYLYEHLYVSGPSYLPFQTNFCLGRGKKFFINGKLEKEEPWYDLTRQDYQISGLIGAHGLVDSCLVYYEEDGFNGGGCLLIRKSPSETGKAQHVDRLFVCDFPTRKGDKLIFSIITKPLLVNTNPKLYIIVSLEENNMDKSVCLEVNKSDEGKTGDENLNGWARCEYILEPPTGRVFEIGCMLGVDNSPLLLGELNIYKATVPH
ncbi:hypothetical protein O3M35_001587 [Rhynocoris fuscipes]|uniref:Cytosolic endo-beta-N-acetylglucosaminidase TIM barrel domain-containing protein n=1 Tax=Rhynocoris fuscipes TaxID=488301 RepID=A0AAW1CN14_9HEMI